ncbi:AAA family ATPase [Corynebacterium sp. L4756]|uniref:AAA family ATPase n=1 Tax=unclassified Corynebacterium TaxID=2624378 RepID=UPI00374D8D64
MTHDTLAPAPGAYGLIGPNAAGKTTLMRKWHAGGNASIAPATADATFAGMTVGRHLDCAHLARPGFNDELTHRILGDIPLKARFSSLSAGQRRLLTLATTLASDKPMLLLDEPLDGLDVATRDKLRTIFIELLEDPQRTLVIATHRAEDLVGLVEYVITVHENTVSEPVQLDAAREDFPTLTGSATVIEEIVAGKQVLDKRVLGHSAAVTLGQPLSSSETARTQAEGIELSLADDRTLINLLAAAERN